jgi:hypothetical protein
MKLEPITENKLIIVEGDDDKNLLSALIEDIGLSGIQIIGCIGKGEMPDVIRTVQQSTGFKGFVQSLGIVRDCDVDAKSAFLSVCDALHKANLSVPPKPLVVAQGTPNVIIVILPCDSEKGALEDVCLQSVSDYPEMSCLNEYFSCLEGIDVIPKNISKAKAQAFLASRIETVPHIGIAAQKRYWPWSHEAFNGIKEFLNKL